MDVNDTWRTTVKQIADPYIRTGVAAAIEKTLLPAAVEKAYPGHFTVVADGSHFGAEHTYPGLDSWELAGAYLLMGRRESVRGYFDFVRASQRKDGNIPFVIAPADTKPEGMDTYGRGMQWPQDVYTRNGRQWIGLFRHWQLNANPLSVLAVVSHILTAREMVLAGEPDSWLRENIESIDAACRHLLSRKSENGLIAGAGFYVECPPRNQWDGVTQCYAVHAMRQTAEMWRILADERRAGEWDAQAAWLEETFRKTFWRSDHFAEYVHPEHGVVDSHGLSDVNWAAVAFAVATFEQMRALWPRMMAEKSLWAGGMPTQLISAPASTYQPWELPEPLPFHLANGPVYDVAAMGRVWYLEAMACRRMGETARLRESVKLVCAMGEKQGWQWSERYHRQPDGSVKAAGPPGYCEYASVLVRVVLGNLRLFSEGA